MIAIHVLSTAVRVAFAALFFNSSSAKAFSLNGFIESLERKLGWGRGPTTTLARSIVAAEVAVALCILAPVISNVGVLSAEALLVGFSAATYHYRAHPSHCSCFGPATSQTGWKDVCFRNGLLGLVGLAAFLHEPSHYDNTILPLFAIAGLTTYWLMPVLMRWRYKRYIRSVANRMRLALQPQ